MHPRRPPIAVAVTTAAALLAVPTAAHAGGAAERPRLAGRAVLPAVTIADGPPSGAAVADANGVDFPIPGQVVAGFSAILAGPTGGEYLAMPDNGFGGKANSRDFLIRAYVVRPDFETAHGGSGTVAVGTHDGEFVSFRDPDGLIGFPIVNEGTAERLLTGGDIDPESLQRGRDGDLWMGDEFGPWILHFDEDGRLLDPPFPTPGGLQSPNNPFLVGPATQPNSRGYEAMSITPDGRHLYAVLEGATVAEAGSTRRQVFEFDTVEERFTGRTFSYRTEQPGHFVADMAALDGNRMVVIERDGGRGLSALFRRVYLVDLRDADPSGALPKAEVVDLAAIPDPDLISLPAANPGDVGLGDPFRVTCESVEAIHPIDGAHLLIGCDNNLPNDGRNPSRADDTELIVVAVPDLRAADAGGPVRTGLVVPFDCGGGTVDVLHTPGGGNRAWQLEPAADLHIKEIEVRVYAGDLAEEPTGVEPLAVTSAGYGERVGQDDLVTCHGGRVVTLGDLTVTMFIDVVATRS